MTEKQDAMRQLLHTFGIKVKKKKKNEGEIILMGNKGIFSANALTASVGILWRIVDTIYIFTTS